MTDNQLPDGPRIVGGAPAFVIEGRVYRPLKCRLCGRNIAMVPTAHGRLQPRDADGGVHFATCAGRKGTRRNPAQLKLF
jgi:hypothetical protein